MRFLAALVAGLIGVAPVMAQQVSTGQGALLRGLDKVNGQVSDMEVGAGGFVELGRLEIALKECRYPAGNPSGDAYAYLTIREKSNETPVYEGWMIASAPALNGLDHARYDVWVMRCKTN
jgi:hypothetical protein